MEAPTIQSLNSKYPGSPDAQNNIPAKQPMSATLRERLRKMRRSYTSPCTVAKRLKIDCEESEIPSQCVGDLSPQQSPQKSSIEGLHPCDLSPPQSLEKSSITHTADTSRIEGLHPADTSTPSRHKDLLQEKRQILKRIEEKEDVLRRLKMVKLYRSKNNPSELQSLIEKWRKSSQLLLYELQSALATENNKISLTQLIESYGLDEKLLQYNRTEEDFEDQ